MSLRHCRIKTYLIVPGVQCVIYRRQASLDDLSHGSLERKRQRPTRARAARAIDQNGQPDCMYNSRNGVWCESSQLTQASLNVLVEKQCRVLRDGSSNHQEANEALPDKHVSNKFISVRFMRQLENITVQHLQARLQGVGGRGRGIANVDIMVECHHPSNMPYQVLCSTRASLRGIICSILLCAGFTNKAWPLSSLAQASTFRQSLAGGSANRSAP